MVTVLYWSTKMSPKLIFFLTPIILFGAVNGEFNRDIQIYEGVIRDIQHHFGNRYIVLFYATDDFGKIFSCATIA